MTAAAKAPISRRFRLSSTLSVYIARQFLFWFGSFLGGLAGVIFLVTLVDLLDRLAPRDAPIALVFEMALLKLPFLSQEIMPFTVLFASMATFWRLTRTNELVVTRAAGVSVWEFLLPVLFLGALLGVILVGAINPLSSVLLSRYAQLESRHLQNESSALEVSDSGLWLRQSDQQGQSVIHAEKVLPGSISLGQVTVFRFQQDGDFANRIDAARADLEAGRWRMTEAWISDPGKAPEHKDVITIPTNLTREKVLESFAPPETISFWTLPEFIDRLTNAGFSALRHRLQLHRLFATPLLFVAMIVLAATFSLRAQRRGGVGLVIMAGVLTGFLLHFVSNFVFALGFSATIPVVLAAWMPAGVSMMLGVAMLFHLEDG